MKERERSGPRKQWSGTFHHSCRNPNRRRASTAWSASQTSWLGSRPQSAAGPAMRNSPEIAEWNRSWWLAIVRGEMLYKGQRNQAAMHSTGDGHEESDSATYFRRWLRECSWHRTCDICCTPSHRRAPPAESTTPVSPMRPGGPAPARRTNGPASACSLQTDTSASELKPI